MKKKKATPKSSPKQSHRYGNSLNAQRQRVLKALQEAGGEGLSTIQIRESLDCMMPAARVHELRHDHGYNIQLIWDRDKNAQGNEHTCGRYILFSGEWRATA